MAEKLFKLPILLVTSFGKSTALISKKSLNELIGLIVSFPESLLDEISWDEVLFNDVVEVIREVEFIDDSLLLSNCWFSNCSWKLKDWGEILVELVESVFPTCCLGLAIDPIEKLINIEMSKNQILDLFLIRFIWYDYLFPFGLKNTVIKVFDIN